LNDRDRQRGIVPLTTPAGIKEVGYIGNSVMATFSVPQAAVDYALKRSPFA
jgi:hypothetical protein